MIKVEFSNSKFIGMIQKGTGQSGFWCEAVFREEWFDKQNNPKTKDWSGVCFRQQAQMINTSQPGQLFSGKGSLKGRYYQDSKGQKRIGTSLNISELNPAMPAQHQMPPMQPQQPMAQNAMQDQSFGNVAPPEQFDSLDDVPF